MRLRAWIPNRRLLIGVGSLVVIGLGLVVGISTYLDRLASREWADACAEADRLDPGWRWEDLVAKSPTGSDNCNGADHVATAFQMIESWPSGAGENSPNINFGLAGSPSQHRMPVAAAAATSTLLTDGKSVFAEIDRVADCRTGWIRLPPSPVLRRKLPEAFASIQVVRSISRRLILRADQGDADGALADARLMLTVAGPPADAPSLLHNIYAAADRVLITRAVERVLAQGEPSPSGLRRAIVQFEAEANRTMYLPFFRGERARIADTIRAMDDGRLSRDEVAASGIFTDPVSLTKWKKADEWLTRLTGADLRRSKGVALFRHHTQVIEWLKESPDGLKIHEAEWAAFRSGMTGAAQTTAVNLSRHVAGTRVAEAPFRGAAAALAAEQFRQETGRWPATLNDLVPKYLSAVPRDPCDLHPLRLARRTDGIVIYSVGEDGTDEGGAIASDGAAKATDIGIRLWDVDKRRQPTLPPSAVLIRPTANPPAAAVRHPD